MSENDRGLPDDFDSAESNDATGDEHVDGAEQDYTAITPEQVYGSFSDLIDDLRGKMTSGGLANKLRAPFANTSSDANEAPSDESSIDEGESADSDSAEPASAEPDGEVSDAPLPPKFSKGVDEFRAALDKRFPGVSSQAVHFEQASPDDSEEADAEEAPDAPDELSEAGEADKPGDVGQFISRLSDKFRHSPKAASAQAPSDLQDAPENASAASADPDAAESNNASDIEPEAPAEDDADEAASTDSDGEASDEAAGTAQKSFIEVTASRIAEASAKRQQARRERREARRLAAEAEEAARAQEPPPVPEETGWGEVDSAHSPGEEESAATRASSGDETEVLASTPKGFDNPASMPPPPASVRRRGDTDSLEAVASERPNTVKFTRKGAPIVKLSSGSSTIKNSMRSVRSTVDALNAGESIDPTKPTIALFAVIIVAATIISASTLFGTSTVSAGSSLLATRPSSTQVETEATTEAEPQPTQAPAAAAPKIASVDVISYNNDDGDHPETAQNLFDGDQGTRWQSRYYAQAELPEGNRVRLVIHLAEEASVKGVTFYGPIDGGQVDLRVNDGSDPFGTPVLTSSKMSGTTELTSSEVVVGNTVTLDFVALPRDDEGRFRAKIDELTVR